MSYHILPAHTVSIFMIIATALIASQSWATSPKSNPGDTFASGPRTSNPTGTQGVMGNPYCPPPSGTHPQNWSCKTGQPNPLAGPFLVAPTPATPPSWPRAPILAGPLQPKMDTPSPPPLRYLPGQPLRGYEHYNQSNLSREQQLPHQPKLTPQISPKFPCPPPVCPGNQYIQPGRNPYTREQGLPLPGTW